VVILPKAQDGAPLAGNFEHFADKEGRLTSYTHAGISFIVFLVLFAK